MIKVDHRATNDNGWTLFKRIRQTRCWQWSVCMCMLWDEWCQLILVYYITPKASKEKGKKLNHPSILCAVGCSSFFWMNPTVEVTQVGEHDEDDNAHPRGSQSAKLRAFLTCDSAAWQAMKVELQSRHRHVLIINTSRKMGRMRENMNMILIWCSMISIDTKVFDTRLGSTTLFCSWFCFWFGGSLLWSYPATLAYSKVGWTDSNDNSFDKEAKFLLEDVGDLLKSKASEFHVVFSGLVVLLS